MAEKGGLRGDDREQLDSEETLKIWRLFAVKIMRPGLGNLTYTVGDVRYDDGDHIMSCEDAIKHGGPSSLIAWNTPYMAAACREAHDGLPDKITTACSALPAGTNISVILLTKANTYPSLSAMEAEG